MAEEKKKGRVILVAIDESEESMRALEWALVNASIGGMDDRLILIHAQRNPSSYAQPATPGYILTGDVLAILQRDVRKFTERVFARAVEICDAKKVTPETKVHVGDARDVLCDAVKRLKPDMLVLGSHGYGPLRRAVLGSVSDYCAHHAECPVVIVRPHKVKASRK